MLITANQPFGEWNKVFPDPAMTIAAIDRLVHHSVVVEMNVDSYRQRAATTRKARTTAKPVDPTTTPPLTNTPDPKQLAACQRQSGATIIRPSAADHHPD